MRAIIDFDYAPKQFTPRPDEIVRAQNFDDTRMKICPQCGRCYEDADATCALDAAALVSSRMGDRVIAGKYRLDRRIGRGGMGAVYAATHIELDRPVAIKLLLPDFISDAQALERFRREARAAARLNHLHVADIYDYGALAGGEAYIAMEMIAGDTLRARLNKAGRFSIADAVMIARQVADGVEAAHRHGIIHRDLKPSNIILCTNCDHQNDTIAKVLDFGIAKLKEIAVTGDAALTNTGMLIGTPRYMSPEQCRGDELDARSDVYSLGVILYEMLAGRPPFDAPSATAIALKHLNEPPPPIADFRPDAPAALARLMMQSLEKEPAGRPATAHDLALELRRIEETLRDTGDTTLPASPQMTGERVYDTQPMTGAPAVFVDTATGKASDAATGRTGSPTLEDSLSPTQNLNLTEATNLPVNETLTRAAAHAPVANNDSPTIAASPQPKPQSKILSPAERPAPFSHRAAAANSSSRWPRLLLLAGLFAVIATASALWYMTRRIPSEPQARNDSPVASPTINATGRVSPTATPVSQANRNTTTLPTPPASDEESLRSALNEWVAATNARDIERQMRFYPPTVPQYYLRSNASRALVRRDKANNIVGATTIDIRIEDPRIEFRDDNRTAIVTFRKSFLIGYGGNSQSGSVLQQMIWSRTPQGWRITSERDLRVF